MVGRNLVARFALQSRSLQEIFGIKHDNNHILNTIWLWLMGNQENWLIYRLLSVLSGIASLAVIPFISIDKRPVEILVCLFLVAFSFPLLLYSTEGIRQPLH